MKRLLLLAFILIPSLSHATISRVQHKKNSGSSITTATGLSVTMTSTGGGATRLLVADCDIRDNTPTTDAIAVTDNQSNTWITPAASKGIAAGIYSRFGFYVLNPTAGVTSITFKPSGGGGSPYTSMVCNAIEYSTNQATFSFDLGNYNTGLTASMTESISITTTGANDIVYVSYSNANGDQDAGHALGGFTVQDSTILNGSHSNQDLLNTAAGAKTGGEDGAGISNGQTFTMSAMAFKEVTSASGQVGAFLVGP